jgi:hypothetical protein
MTKVVQPDRGKARVLLEQFLELVAEQTETARRSRRDGEQVPVSSWPGGTSFPEFR